MFSAYGLEKFDGVRPSRELQTADAAAENVAAMPLQASFVKRSAYGQCLCM